MKFFKKSWKSIKLSKKLKKFPKMDDQDKASLKKFISSVILMGLLINFAVFIIFSIKFTWYSWIGWGFALHFIKTEVVSILRRIVFKN